MNNDYNNLILTTLNYCIGSTISLSRNPTMVKVSPVPRTIPSGDAHEVLDNSHDLIFIPVYGCQTFF